MVFVFLVQTSKYCFNLRNNLNQTKTRPYIYMGEKNHMKKLKLDKQIKVISLQIGR